MQDQMLFARLVFMSGRFCPLPTLVHYFVLPPWGIVSPDIVFDLVYLKKESYKCPSRQATFLGN